MKCVVICPKGSGRWPVVYLLHGWTGKYSNWIMKVPAIVEYAQENKIMIVCPDGDVASWYFDSPIDSSSKYETYISKEVPAYIDAHYKTVADRNARAITGLSMGGHGALFIAFRHADIFGACGSMSGGVDLNSSKGKFGISQFIGDTINYASNWNNFSVIHQVETPPSESLAILFDCGLSDFFFPSNRALHEKMLRLKIPHDYTERPGNHDWNYWANSVQYHLIFFKNFFRGKNGKRK